MKNIEEILTKARTIAMVGLSPNPDRPSGKVAEYLVSRGYTIIPVNPMVEEVMGMKSYGSLLDIPGGVRVDIVDVFRKSEDTPPIAREAVKIHASCLWLQLGVTNEESGNIAREAGLDFVQDKCIKMEHQRRIG